MSYGVKDILGMEVAPALGCTEPSAIALAAAAAASLLGAADVDNIEIWADPNVYKNGLAVSIPGARGESGLDLAAAVGVFGGDPSRRLEVLETLDDEALARAKSFLREHPVRVHVVESSRELNVRAVVSGSGHVAECRISKVHDNITALSLDGDELGAHPLLSLTTDDRQSLEELERWLITRSLQDLLDFLDDLDDDDLQFIEQGISYNLRLAEHGRKYGPGLGIGLGLERLVRERLLRRDMILDARILTSAAADARMSGVKLPAMSSGGSGNHGLTAVLPIWAVKAYVDSASRRQMLESVALSHLVTAYIKALTGRLSAVCGCSVAAGAGATAGVTYLLGGNHQHIAGAIKNLVGDLAGVICDGAKASCALKLATAAGAAVQAALFSLHGINVQATDGIIGASPEGTMRNVGTLSTEGMIETDRTILRIMLEKQFENV